MTTALVTGACGYIGSILCKILHEKKWDVIGIDNLSNGEEKPIHKDVHMIFDDMSALRRMRFKVDVIFNLAARSQLTDCEKNNGLALHDNHTSLLYVLDFMKRSGNKSIVHASTSGLYDSGSTDAKQFTEETSIKATSYYAETKFWAEEQLNGKKSLRRLIFRFFNVTGAYKGMGESLEITDHILPKLYSVLSGKTECFEVYGADFNTHDGTPVRDYIHVKDICDGLIRGAEYVMKKENKGCELINLGSGKGRSVLDVIADVEKEGQGKIKYETGAPRGIDPDYLVCSYKKAREILGWEPKTNYLEGMSQWINKKKEEQV